MKLTKEISAVLFTECVDAIVAMKKRSLLQSTQDILVKYGVLADDNFNIVYSLDGTRVDFDKVNPRTEITIERMAE